MSELKQAPDKSAISYRSPPEHRAAIKDYYEQVKLFHAPKFSQQKRDELEKATREGKLQFARY